MPSLPKSRISEGRRRRFCSVVLLLVWMQFLVAESRAGDILRGGAALGPRDGSSQRSKSGQAAAARAAANAQDRLARTTQALKAVRDMQSSARNAALNSGANNLGKDPNHPGMMLPNVPDGLQPGGLVLSGQPIGAKNPQQTSSGGNVTVTVKQQEQQALLEWSSFNVGKKTTLYFDQRSGGSESGNWIAFNRVTDPSGSPSQILGSIKAEGQVYVINQNGIIFGGGSQVNVHALVASSLPINQNLLNQGLLNNPDQQFLFTALPIPSGQSMPAFNPPPVLTPSGKVGDVTVQAGAVISAPTNEAHVGGRVALVGANVSNQGTISTPDGQTILAAGLQVGMTAHNSDDPSLRGLDVWVGSVGDYAGLAVNRGVIDAQRASVIITGKDVQQLGAIESSTSVSLNGRIDLLANYGAVPNPNYDPKIPTKGAQYYYSQTGLVTLGVGSVMRILPEWGSAETAVGTELALRSQINLQGKVIHLGSDSMILAPNALITGKAGQWGTANNSEQPFVFSSGQIYVDSGALVDVAGTTGVNVALGQNIMTLQLRGSELANSPLQRDQMLRAVNLTLDMRITGYYNGRFWVGTPLGDATGFLGVVQRPVDELTVAGGTVDFTAGGSVVVAGGSTIDVSGGYVNYLGGYVQTTRVLYGSNLINIEDATPDKIYDGIYSSQFTKTNSKWGVSQTYTKPLALTGGYYEKDYISGAAGGNINIVAPSMALDGDMAGHTVIGPRQMRKSSTLSTLPGASSLTLRFKAQDATPDYLLSSPTPPNIVFQYGGNSTPVGAFAVDELYNPLPLPQDRLETVILSPDILVANGFGNLTVESADGDIFVPQGVELEAPAFGSITLTGANINIQGHVSSPGGILTFNVYNISPAVAAHLTQDAPAPPANLDRGMFTLGSGASLDTAGLIVDDRRFVPEAYTSPIAIKGGSIAINTFSADLAEGSTIDVSGGALMTAAGRKTYGDAGSISIITGQDLGVPSVLGGHLELGSTLLGYSRTKGGSLTIQAPLIQIGGSPLSADTLLFQPEFFSQGGFGTFTLKGIGVGTDEENGFLPGLYIAPGTVIAPVSQSVVGVPYPGGGKGLELRPAWLPREDRTPVSLNFEAIHVDNRSGVQMIRGDLVMGEGSLIVTDPLGKVSLKGDTVAVMGSIYAPGGSITIAGASNSSPLFGDLDATDALPTVYISANSVLSAAGTVLYDHDPYGRRVGSVLPGGTISVAGNIFAEAGAILDVSGASGTFDLHPSWVDPNYIFKVPASSGLTTPLFSLQTIPVQLDSSGGTIILKGGQMLFSEATLRGEAGGPAALGGSLVVSSGRFYGVGQTATPLDPNLVVTQTGQIHLPAVPYGQTPIGKVVVDSSGTPIPQMGYFGVDAFTAGGFDSLTLGGVVQFAGPVTIDARGMIAVADGGVMYADSDVNLSAAYIKLGKPFEGPVPPEKVVPPFQSGGQPYYFDPTYGPGRLTVRADLIDIGTLSLQGIGEANFIADNGEIRGNGTLNMAGDIYMRAGQIYPLTATTFTIVAYDHGGVDGSVTIASSGVLPLPMSAGGTLNIYASEINQGGVLRAPLGSINIGWDGTGAERKDPITNDPFPVAKEVNIRPGSITSVSAIDPITGLGVSIPYGINLNGTSWIDPMGRDISATGLPQKSITIAGASVNLEAGSTIDLRGGGDLYAYRWVSGLGGTEDILASTTSFAVIPGHQGTAYPYAPYYTGSGSGNLGGDPGYVNSSLQPGDKVYLAASGALPAGVYTLLPARYALQPGAVLVTPQTGEPLGTVALPDGSSIVSGYRFNDLNSGQTGPTLVSRFEVAPASVVRSRAEYVDYSGNIFFVESAKALGINPPRLPFDAGHLVLQASQSMVLQGNVLAQGGGPGARGGMIDIASTMDIVIVGAGQNGGPGVLTLDAGQLSSFGAESLLIGGVRHQNADNTWTVDVKTDNILVDNAGTPLTAPDIVLVANDSLELAAGAEVIAYGGMPQGADTLLIGDKDTPGSGNGVLLRVSSDMYAETYRSGVVSGPGPSMIIGAGATISGGSLVLDSTYATSLDSSATLDALAIYLASGQISLQFDNPGALQPTVGLVLSGNALESLQGARILDLQSYTSIDIYGTGSFQTDANLTLHAGEIRGFNNGGGSVSFEAGSITLDNRVGAAPAGPVAPLEGTLEFHSNNLRFGEGQINVSQFANLILDAPGGIIAEGSGGLGTQGDLHATTSVFTGEDSAKWKISAGGEIVFAAPANGGSSVSGGLGASLTLEGASISVASNIVAKSGLIELHATSGDLNVSGLLDAGGTQQTLYDLVKYTNAGIVNLSSDHGSVVLAEGSEVNVSAAAGGGNAGLLSIATPEGAFTLDGLLRGEGGAGGKGGSFALDVGALSSLADVNAVLEAASFTEARSIRVRTGDVLVDGINTAHRFILSTDQGSITVAGTIDASGETGGEIALIANGSVTLLNGSLLTVAGERFSNAGKGGSVTLEAGAQTNGIVNPAGYIDIQTGSTIDLSVASLTPQSAGLGQFAGTLHLRAPQTAAGNNLQVQAINGNIIGASSILVEGYKLFDLTLSGGQITSGDFGVRKAILDNGDLFMGSEAAITSALLANNAGLSSVFVLAPGAEIINTAGDLTLGDAFSTEDEDWDLSTYRFGSKQAAGVLTLRAAGDIVFYNALSDGFTATGSPYSAPRLFQYVLMEQNLLLPANAQSYTYRMTAGADFAAADYHQVQSLAELDAAGLGGSLKLGKNNGDNSSNSNGTSNQPGSSARTELALRNRFQVIRTGSGDIDISAGRDVQLLNHFATIYTAGTRVVDATMGGAFDLPNTVVIGTLGDLGSSQQIFGHLPQYSMAGGDVNIYAQRDIAHYTQNTLGELIADSQRQMPTNWLNRRGYIDPLTGEFGVSGKGEVASTTWWVDYTNFFQGVGTLGGGDVNMTAGRDVSNVDAVAVTNARMAKGDPDSAAFVELGGGDVTVRAGRDIDGGVYYVERGNGTLIAGDSIHTNSTRSPSLVNLESPSVILPSETWLPTTLFLGKGSFDVSARGDILLGPVANPFLMPQGINNSYWYKTYFSTYSPESAVNVTSLGGSVTLRESTTLLGNGSDAGLPTSMLQAWYQNQLLLSTSSASNFQPWLRLVETSVDSFSTVFTLMPPTLKATAFAGDINVVGDITLAPSANGTLEFAAAGSLNGLQPNGNVLLTDGRATVWGTSTINVSDADPSRIPGVTTPFAYQTLVGTVAARARVSAVPEFLMFVDNLFAESGSTDEVIQTKQALHAPGLLHSNDPNPVRFYAQTGNISGFTLFSPKFAQVFAGQDITDISLYIQNVNEENISIVSSGRDIVLYNANAPLRVAANSAGNILNTDAGPLAGDIQISGPGTLEVLAGRNIDLGTGENFEDGTGVGITSVGNSRNPYLTFGGADLVVAAGVGAAPGLANSGLNFDEFIDTYVAGPAGQAYLNELKDQIPQVPFDEMTPEQQAIVAFKVLALILRDAGRAYTTDGESAYASGYAAIDLLFGDVQAEGSINTRSRDIRTKNGGDINIVAPNGGLTLAQNIIGTPLAPPGIITESGGDISIFTRDDVNIGVGRIFTLRGGDEIIWSSEGDIAAGAASKTVKTAPPTRVLINPQSANVETDLAGLATGGGIGVLATVAGVPPGDVDLIAPSGAVDAGDAGIRVSGNLNIAAERVLNADNISVGGASAGVPSAPVVAAPNIAGLTAASNTAGASVSAATDLANQAAKKEEEREEEASVITVEVLGYGGEDYDSASL
jgi:filamentous hemagglutinin